MSLEFTKLVEQVQTMGRFLGHRSQSSGDKLRLALELFAEQTDLAPINERIRYVRENVSGYRGAAPAPGNAAEIICAVGAPPAPEANQAVVIAVDGSQVYPDPHGASLYYLINIGSFVYYHHETQRPEQATIPHLYYNPTALEDKDGRIISNQTVNSRRSVMELQTLADISWSFRKTSDLPRVAIHDGGLLKFFGGVEVAGGQEIERDYMEALQKLYDAGALLCGYLDKPRSTYVISLLHLMYLAPEQLTEVNLRTNGPLEGLNDTVLFSYILGPGERSAIMTQNSPQNREYIARKGPNYEVAFFYLNVSAQPSRPSIARIDLPLWVARDEAAVEELHGALLAQCAIQGRRQFPYALTRADELAYVSSVEKAQLDELIRIEMLRNQLEPEASNKLESKWLARSSRQQHRLRA